MSGTTKFGKFLRIVGLILLGLTAVFHLLGGVGTSCVAFGAEKYDSMAAITPFKWLYLLFVFFTILTAVFGIQATIRFGRSKPRSYQQAILFLAVGLALSLIHMFTSRALRGSSMPNDARVYLNALTLIVFALFGLKNLRQAIGIGSESESGSSSGGLGAVFVIMGIVTLTIHLFAGPTHTWNGINYADVWHAQLQFAGWGLVAIGAFWSFYAVLGRQPGADERQPISDLAV